jgi:aspartate/methionine/tyrosine aminotransferase
MIRALHRSKPMAEPAARTRSIEPFYVMEVVKEAARLEAGGTPVIHIGIGEPDFTAPALVQRAAIEAIGKGATQYTPALGIRPLRRAIAGLVRISYANAYERLDEAIGRLGAFVAGRRLAAK